MRIDTDHRSDVERAATVWFAVATDKFMSGWGGAPGRSIFAVPCRSLADAEIAADNLRARSEMRRVRVVNAASWRPRLSAGDHLSVSDMGAYWFTPGYFAAREAERRARAR